VARSPLYQGDQYLGLAQGVFDISSLLQSVSRTLTSQYGILLKDANGTTFWEDGPLLGDTLSSTVLVGDNQWSLTLGWAQPEPQPQPYILGLIWGLGGALLTTVLFAFNQASRQMERLATSMATKTAELTKSQTLYRTLVETADDIILLTDMSGRHLFRNNAYYTTLGYEPQADPELNGLIQVHPEDEPLIQQQMNQLIETGVLTTEYRMRRKDGHWLYCSVRTKVIPPTEGHSQSILMIIRDLTKRKAAEATQAKLEEELRQAQKMESVGRLAGGMAHDFNNLLTVIQGYSELMQSHMAADDPLRRGAEQIQRAAESAAGLTRQLLAFSRKQLLAPIILDLNGLVENLRKMLPRLIGEDIHLEITLAAALHPVLADPGQLEQVLLNLAVNARDAMPTGGRLTIETANIQLDEIYQSNHLEMPLGPAVMLTVTDTGQGMDKQIQSQIFEPFFTTKEMGRGTGLGLATVYGIVKQSGGDIHVYSEPGQGATFKIYLPAAKTTPHLSFPQQTVPEVPGGSETILLVEDEEIVRRLVITVLEEKGYSLLEAERGDEALALVQAHPGQIDLLITDVVMPGMSGRVLAEQLAALRPGQKVLYTSGYTDDAVVRHGLLTAEVEFLSKPFSPTALAAKVRQVLDK
jgi:PAS domain S-box-containing protein